MISSESTLSDVAFAVCTALDRTGFVAVLTGGSAATYYAPDAYQSLDIDFVLTFQGKGGEAALRSLGFRRKADFYVHPQSRFPLEFPPGPLAIGDDLVTTWRTVRRDDEVLHVLTPFDSCRDRLASYLYWNDLSGLEQALHVHRAHAHDVDLERLRDWCRQERQLTKFELYEARLKPSR